MCEILVKAVDQRMPTASEWRTWINGKLPEFQAYIAAYADVPTVEVWAKIYEAEGSGTLSLTQEQINKIRAYYSENNPEKASIVSRWKYAKHQVDVEAAKSDAEKGAELALKDRRGCYKLGDPVVVMEDGHVWGALEGPPKFYIIKIPGLAVATVRKYISAWQDTTEPEKPATTLQRRLYRINVANLPANIKNALTTAGVVSTTFAKIRTYIINQKTGASE